MYIAKDGQTYRYLANNRNFESYIKIVKVDAETGKVIPLAGAGFRLYRPDGSLITQTFTYPEVTTIDTFYTNSEGYLITPEKLEYGKGYSLVEVSAPYGYTLSGEPVYFDVTADNATEENAVTVVEVTKPNMAQKGVIKISKSGEVFSSVTEADGLYQPVFSVRGLPGAVYEITAAEDIITPDGTRRASAGEVVDTVTTDETGLAESKPLYLGKYEIREITAPGGYVLNTEIRTAELAYAGQEIEIAETAADFYNERQKATVSLDKVLEQNEQFGIGMNGEITAVTFGLFAAEDLTAADGSIIPADGLLEILSVDENGHAVCKTDLPFGSYYLKELSTDGHYILSDEKYPIVFDYAGQDTALVEIKVNNGNPIGNDLIYGEIHGLKKDEDGNALGGALIGLFKADCTEFTRENAILTATSAEDGGFSFADVPYGNWLVREIKAPTGFVLSDETFAVTVDKDGAVIEVEIENARIRGTVQLTKVDKDYPDNKLTGAEFAVYRDSNGNKELDADDELLGTLTETGIGFYEMPDLRYGGYFVKETKAPEGFYLDEHAYYFEITEHGKTVTVENEAGKGFVNAAQVGSLKIFKTSSDGKVEGFSFRVTGPNGYSEIFTTDKNGEILIENLRIGEYVVFEVSDGASSAYILPADKTASVFEGAVTKVEMHNELRDTPKTGDDSNPALWLSLLGISAVGAAVLGVIGLKKKKTEKEV
ncbi:SpaA isopeptide-forming pilin-related protein [Hominenteromicrobium sp.]|uniref:SpaA isopeptide-forming pilin-related protein n=1 Tax=Hominenteromicrobium sp. TaxID=3073581 RepID=UPI003AF07916